MARHFLPAGQVVLSAVLSLLVPASSAAGQTAAAQSSPGLQRLSIEELGRISVLSSSRHTEPVSGAAAAITVLTSDALRRAGARSLPDALRLAVGVAVGRAGHAWSISARGFNSAASNKMVVMLDGRSLYTPLFSGVFWEVQDVLLADVDRIEIVRGAGGSLWGANAMNGVINIITKLAGETPGALVEVGTGSAEHIISARYGGSAGTGAYRAYARVRHLDGMPLLDGTDSDEPMRAGQAGMRVDFGPTTATSLTLQGDAYGGRIDFQAGADTIDFSGGNVLTRIRRTFSSGAQLQLQAYYDHTQRRVPTQYAERRQTADVELQHRMVAGGRHEIVSGVGVTFSHDETTPTQTFFFEPASRTFTLVNVFAQDEISLVPGRLSAILGSKFEHNSYTGFEIQPTARMRWTPGGYTVWAAVSRAVRMPTRFDTDLRFTANQPFVVLRGSEDFKSETMISGEVGVRTYAVPKLAIGATAFTNAYNDIRSQEPTPPFGVPIVLANRHQGRISGAEIDAHVDPFPAWRIWAGYTYLRSQFEFEPGSGDPTGGSLEHNDPSQQVWVRSFTDLPGGVAFDATFRWVGALPNPVVPSYAELTLRVARPLTDRLALEVVGDNLLHERHPEWFNLGPRQAVPRSVFVRLTWQSR